MWDAILWSMGAFVVAVFSVAALGVIVGAGALAVVLWRSRHD